MQTQTWVTDRYLTVTRDNFSRAATIGNDVVGALFNAAPGNIPINALYNYLNTANEAYQTKFAALDTAIGNKEGATLGLEQMIKGLRAKAKAWRKAIANVYDEITPEYKTILPNGIAPFTGGKQANIIQAIMGLAGRLTAFPDLDATKTDVLATHVLLLTTNTTQKGKIGARNTASDGLELARIALCKALLYVEAGLTQIYIDDLAQVDAFFPLYLLRRSPQSDFMGSVPANGLKNIVKRKLDGVAELRLHNTGDVPVTFYFGVDKAAPLNPGMQHKEVLPQEDVIVPANELGASSGLAFFMVKNDSAIIEGHWEVTL